MRIEIGNKKYNVEIAQTDEEKTKELQGKKELAEDEGMLFIYDEPQTVGFWMQDTNIPLDIIFINKDFEIISIYKRQPHDETIAEEDDVQFILEVNQNSGIKKGDELDIDNNNEIPTMKIIAPNGSTQMELNGKERIFNRKNTKTLIRMAKRADKSKADRDYKALRKKMFTYLKQQDEREPEYVETKD